MWHWITHHLQLLLLAAVAIGLLRAVLRAPAGGAATGNAVAGLFGALFAVAAFVFKAGWKVILLAGGLLMLLAELMPDGTSGGATPTRSLLSGGQPYGFDPNDPLDLDS